MARGRKQLTDKQERILVQCQLMGLTTADLVTISNRMVSLEKERKFKEIVNAVAGDFEWKSKDKRNFTLTHKDGRMFEVKIRRSYQSYSYVDFADICISKPGTRFKTRTIKDHKLTETWDANETAGACPEGNKWIFRTMRDINRGRFDK